MSILNLDALLKPASVAVIGASDRTGSVGTVVFRNLLEGGFRGPVMPVHPDYDEISGIRVSPTVADLPAPPDLGVVCTPPHTVPGLIDELGAAGARAAVVLTAGVSGVETATGNLRDEMLRAARRHSLRILGPNCVGLLVPGIGLNCGFAHVAALPGKLAFLSQSGGLTTAVLDWARARGIGFSHFVSLGDSADVDVGDMLDYLSTDPSTSGILLYLESVRHARKFLSAGRAAARTRHVVLIKSGRVAAGARAAATHTGALAGSDAVFDAAVSRAGMLRVFDIDELFDAVETLALGPSLRGERLAVLTNGGGPGVMVTDYLSTGGGEMANLEERTLSRLDGCLPPTWSRANPVDIIGDAGSRRYGSALAELLEAPEVDVVLVLHSPVALVSPTEVAEAVVDVARASKSGKPVFTSWIGGDTVREGRDVLHRAGIPTYETPERAARAFLHLVRYRRNQEMLVETPATLGDRRPDYTMAAGVIELARRENREWLTEPESKRVLAAYGIPIVESRIAGSVAEAVDCARDLGFPVAVKILAPDITHKSDVGGVALDLHSPVAVERASERMAARLESLRPGAVLDGFVVQQMARRPAAHELIVGTATDPVFGPVVVFGQGGTAVEVIGDRAVALPPLNETLARRLVAGTRVAGLLAGYRDRPRADMDSIHRTLVQVSRLVIDQPRIRELDVNPLLADDLGVLALDARIRIDLSETGARPRLAIRPYPEHLEERAALRDGSEVLLRPIRPEDEPAHREFFRTLSAEDVHYRFFGLLREMSHSSLARYTVIDYDREMAFIATTEPDEEGPARTLGVVRTVSDPDNTRAEFAIVVSSPDKARGLGRLLLEKMIRYCRDRGMREIVGHVLPGNRPMLELARSLGFEQSDGRGPGEDVVEVRLELDGPMRAGMPSRLV